MFDGGLGLMLSRVQGKYRKLWLAVSVVLLVLGLLFTLVAVDLFVRRDDGDHEVFIGVDVGYGGASEVYRVADAVRGFANLVIVGSTRVTGNTSMLIEVCDFLYQRGFHFIVYVGFGGVVLPLQGPNSTFFDLAVRRWGDRFLGAYTFDEVGGKQMDYNMSNPDKPVPKADSDSDAALHFLINVEPYLFLNSQISYTSASNLKLYTSDYALYWYDFLCGYGTVFCEFAGNQSRQVAVALDRGAAKTLGRSWGAIVTYPCAEGCLETGTQLYDDMVLAWQSGARYVVVFDGNSTTFSPYGVLMQEHLDAMKRFWDKVNGGQRFEEFPADVAYVLPADYGYGFRGPEDKIWGLRPADALSAKVWNDTSVLLAKYSGKLDVVYENKTDGIPIDLPYRTLIFWNGTTIQR
jgi:hypothetical protein